MRIAFVVTQFPCVSETFIAAQIAGLRARGHEVHVYADEPGPPATPADLQAESPASGLRVYHPLQLGATLRRRQWHDVGTALLRGARACSSGAFWSGALPYGLRTLIAVGRYAAAHRTDVRDYDVIHAHFGPNGVKAAAMRSARLLRGELVVTFHGYDLSRHLRDAGGAGYARLFREAALCLPVTHRWAQRLVELGCPADRIRVHRMGIDSARFSFAERAAVAGRPVELITVARLVEKKGIAYALRALALLAREGDFRYTIIGDGPERQRLSGLIDELGIGARVRMLGARGHADVLAHLRAADIAIMPSHTAADGDEEGLPVALMEAMATGLPVISTYHSGIPELVTDGVEGFLVDERDGAALSRRIALLAGDPALRAAMGRAARLRVEHQHDQRRLDEELLACYRSVSSRRAPARGAVIPGSLSIRNLLPVRWRHGIVRFAQVARAKAGRWRVQCPVCHGRFRRFLPAGEIPRENARCPRCDALERHRLVWLLLNRQTTAMPLRGRMLHIAPEPCLESVLRGMPGVEYVTADLVAPGVQVWTDLTNLAFPSGAFDVILCSHVLEHVHDDRRAMAELERVLKPGGWALLHVPVDLERQQTFEDARITEPDERARVFGQWDHVRIYGRDYAARLQAAGFAVEASRFAYELSESIRSYHGLQREPVYLCRKSRAAAGALLVSA
jgi:colanic acid/amylovoran biosynthesis glycosyltransferase